MDRSELTGKSPNEFHLCAGVDGSCGPSTVTWKLYADNCYHFSYQDLGATLTSIPGQVETSFIQDG